MSRRDKPNLTARVSRVLHRASLSILALTALLVGCGTRDAAGPLIPEAQGRVRFVTLITDTTRGRVDVSLESVPFGVNLVYGGSTPSSLPAPATAVYSPVLTGNRSLVLVRTANPATSVTTIPFTAATGADYTVYATGGAGASAIAPFITADTNAAPATGQVRVRVVHLAPSAGNVDVFVTAVGADLAAATPALANFLVRGAAYLAVAAGTYQVRVVPAGTAPAARSVNVAINIASVALGAGSARTIIAAENNVGGAPFRFVTLTDR